MLADAAADDRARVVVRRRHDRRSRRADRSGAAGGAAGGVVVRVEPALQRRGARRHAAPRERPGRQAHAGDGATRGGRAPRRASGRPAVRGGVGEGRRTTPRPGWWVWCRRPCSCPAPRSTRCSCGCDRRAAPPVSVPSAEDLFALVRAGFAQRRKMLRRSLRADARRAHRRRARRPRAIAPTARAEALGLEEWAARRRAVRRRPREARARPGHRVPEAHAVAARARVAATTASTTSRRWSISLGQPHDVLEAYAVPRPVACSSRSSATRSASDVPVGPPRTSRSSPPRSCWSAPGDRATACASCCASRFPRAAGSAVARPTPRPRCSRSGELLDVDIDDDGVIGARGRGRVRRAVLPARRRGVDARARRDHRAGRRRHRAARSWSRSRRSGSSTPDVYRGVGRAGRPAVASAWCRRRGALAHIIPELVQRPRARGRGASSRGWSSSATRSRAAAGAPALLAGSGSAYVVPVADAAPPAASRRRSRCRCRTRCGVAGACGDDRASARGVTSASRSRA